MYPSIILLSSLDEFNKISVWVHIRIIVSLYFTTMTFDEIIKDKNDFQEIISSGSDINLEVYVKRVANSIADKYKKLVRKYHSDKFGYDRFNTVPYVSQIWHLLNSSNNLLKNYSSNNLKSYHDSIQNYRSNQNFWDEEEAKKNLGPIKERIQKFKDEEKMKGIEKENETTRKQQSIKRKEDEEKLRKQQSIKRKEEEEKLRKQNSIEQKIQRRKQFAEDDKKNKKKKEDEELRRSLMKRKIDDDEVRKRQDSLNKKVERARKFEEEEKKNRIERENTQRRQESLNRKTDEEEAIRRRDSLKRKNDENEGIRQDYETEMDVDVQYSQTTKRGRRNDNYVTNKTKRHHNRRKERIHDFMENKTVKRRELIDNFRNRNEKMDIVNHSSNQRSRTQKRRSAVDRIRDYFTP